jgi:hypothetical protein
MPTARKEPYNTFDVMGTKYMVAPRRRLIDIDLDHVIDIDDVLGLVNYAAETCMHMTGPYFGDGGIVNAGGMWMIGDTVPDILCPKDKSDQDGRTRLALSPWVFTATFANYGNLLAVFALGGPDGPDNDFSDPFSPGPVPLCWDTRVARHLVEYMGRTAMIMERCLQDGQYALDSSLRS